MRPPCEVEGCDRPQHAAPLCTMHSRRVAKTGDVHRHGGRGGRPLKGKYPTWAAVHKRLARTRGPARGYACVDCGKRAQEWSYDGTDPAELTGKSHEWELAYSLDLTRYQPRCASCHRLFDKRLASRPGVRQSLELLIEAVPA